MESLGPLSQRAASPCPASARSRNAAHNQSRCWAGAPDAGQQPIARRDPGQDRHRQNKLRPRPSHWFHSPSGQVLYRTRRAHRGSHFLPSRASRIGEMSLWAAIISCRGRDRLIAHHDGSHDRPPADREAGATNGVLTEQSHGVGIDPPGFAFPGAIDTTSSSSFPSRPAPTSGPVPSVIGAGHPAAHVADDGYLQAGKQGHVAGDAFDVGNPAAGHVHPGDAARALAVGQHRSGRVADLGESPGCKHVGQARPGHRIDHDALLHG